MDRLFEKLMEPQPVLHLAVKDGGIAASGQSRYERRSPVDDGPYLRWSWDGAELTAGNDRFGMLPCFYAADEAGFCISTSIRALLDAGVPADLDFDALSVMLHFGQFVGDGTPFVHIKALPANARLRWSAAGLEVTGGPSVLKPDPLPRDQAIDAFVDLFAQSMRRHLDKTERFLVPLTGGRDSRHILFEAVTQRREPEKALTAAHFPIRRNDDIAVAQAVCAELGVPHQALATQGSYVDAEASKFEPLEWLSFEHVFCLPVLAYLNESPAPLFDGLAGDILSAGLLLTEQNTRLYEAGKIEKLGQLLCSSAAAQAILTPQARACLSEERAHAALVRELRRHEGSSNPMSNFLFWNRTRRNVSLAPYRLIAGSTWPVHTPFVTTELFDLLMSQPSSHFLAHTFHDEAIARAYPQWADIPFEVKGAAYREPKSFIRSKAASLARYRPLRRAKSLNRRRLFLTLARACVLPGSGGTWWLRRALYFASLEDYLTRRGHAGILGQV